MAQGHFREFEEEYLETLYEFYESNPDLPVRTGDLAKALDVSPASVTEMVQRLAKNGFLNYEKYKGVTLTPSGFSKGRAMKRRHRIIETFLVKSLFFQGDVHETACMLEHAVNDDLEQTLDKILNYPDINPEGKPIPSLEKGLRSTLPDSEIICSAVTLKVGQKGEVVAFLMSAEESKALAGLGICLGCVMERDTDETWRIGASEIQLSEKLGIQILLNKC